MIFPLLLAASALQGNPFTEPIPVANLGRLPLTPVLDGKMDPEEWDAFANAGEVESFFQWEPGKLHFAAKLEASKELLASFDLEGNGWLKGADNLEIKVNMAEAGPELSARTNDCTDIKGPAWKNAIAILTAAKFTTSRDGEWWFVEATIEDPGLSILPTNNSKPLGIRFDAVPKGADFEAYLPRTMAMTTLVTERASNLPEGLIFGPEGAGRVTVPGGKAKIRLTFKGTDELGLKRIEMRGEGYAKEATESGGKPFPAFDNKKRAYVDYETDIARDATDGYRLMRATLTNAEGEAGVLQTSYYIAPILTFELEKIKGLQASPEAKTVRFGVTLQSNTTSRLDGVFNVKAPEGWTVEKGNGKSFVIYNRRGAKRQVFELTIPGGFKGTIPLKLMADIGDKHLERTAWLTVE